MNTRTYVIDATTSDGIAALASGVEVIFQEDLIVRRVVVAPVGSDFIPGQTWPSLILTALTLGGRPWITNAIATGSTFATALFAPGPHRIPLCLPVRKGDRARFAGVVVLGLALNQKGIRIAIQGHPPRRNDPDLNRETFCYDVTPALRPGVRPVTIPMEHDYDWTGFFTHLNYSPHWVINATEPLYRRSWKNPRECDLDDLGAFTATGPTFYPGESNDRAYSLRYELAQDEWRTRFLALNVAASGLPYSQFCNPLRIKKGTSPAVSVSQSATINPFNSAGFRTVNDIRIVTVGDHLR